MNVVIATLDFAVTFGAAVAALALAGFAFAVIAKHLGPPARPSWRQLVDSLRMED